MILLGLDFDNTIVKYDELFNKLAIEKGLISNEVAKTKIQIRDHLRSMGKDQEFTLLQGEVYGKRILEAKPAKHVLETLSALSALNVSMTIVSHKSKIPYKGPKYDLHKSAWNWLEKYKILSKKGVNLGRNKIHFEETKEKKIKKIIELGCTHYIDDLEEILTLLPETIAKIHYTKEGCKSNHKQMTDWNIEVLKEYLRI